VIPARPVIRLTDLTHDEVSSLFLTVQKVGQVVEKAFKADALTIACQVNYCYL
jgi:bis(5'-adenosyl)-triphosphatase